MTKPQHAVRLLAAVCAASLTAAAALPVRAADADKAAEAAAENIPSVPVRVLRPDAERTQKVDAFTRAVPASEDQVRRAAELRAEAESADFGYRMNENHVIPMKPGENVFIPIAVNHPNRIVTPFRNPQVVSTTLTSGSKPGECGEICVRDSVVYVSTDKTYPVTAFITEGGREDIALSVTMMPRQVPPREVKLTVPEEVMDSLRAGSDVRGGGEAAAWETSQPYVDTIRTAFRTIALGNVPQGYTLRDVRSRDPLPVCRHPGLEFDFANGQILEGHNLSVYVGVIRNVASTPVEFREQRCGGWRIAAVTSWPLKVLKPGQATEVYLAVKREDDKPALTVRKPLIPREYN